MKSESSLDARLREALAPFGLRAAILFGSVARGTETHESDIDVAVLGQGPLRTDEKIAITEALALEFGRAVDLVDLQRVGEPLLGSILEGGRRVLGRAAEWGDLLSRHWVNQADFVPLQERILRTRRTSWIGQ